MTKKAQTFKNKRSKNPFKLICWYGWVGAIITLILHLGLYKLADFAVRQYADNFWSFCPKISELDDKIPFCAYFFIEIYVLAYGVWFICPLIISVGSKKNFTNFMIYNIVAHLVGFVLLLTCPSWQNRGSVGSMAENMQANIDSIKTPISKFLMSMIVGADGMSKAWNMSPSFHVLSSLICLLGVLNRKDIHVSARISVYSICSLIILSTVFVKQHYLLDVFCALSLGFIIYIIIMCFKPGDLIVDKFPNYLVLKIKSKKYGDKK